MIDPPLKKLRAKRIRIHRQLDKLEPLLAAYHFKLAYEFWWSLLHDTASIPDRADPPMMIGTHPAKAENIPCLFLTFVSI